MNYLALAFYRFIPIESPHELIACHKTFFQNKELTGRIYISEEGINAQLSGSVPSAHAYMEWIQKEPSFKDLFFNIQPCHEQIFPRMTVKYRKQLVALDEKVDISETGVHLSPEKWRAMLEEEEDKIVIDVRNDYEWEIGHFEGATLPPLTQFRDFPKYAALLKTQIDPQKTKVMMYCTGGIRCELYSALLKKKGFEKVYQLQGGIINYGNKEGQKHWKGKLFVFDDRLAVSIDEKESTPIATCQHCNKKTDTYFNCANMDCNTLFRACATCLPLLKGCCSNPCSTSPRLRPFEREGNKPFRRKHLIEACSIPSHKSDSSKQ